MAARASERIVSRSSSFSLAVGCADDALARWPQVLFALCVALLLGVLAAVPSESSAATPATEYETVPVIAPDQGTRARFGRLKVAGDIDGDGANDLFASAQNLDVGGVTGAGRAYALSGRTRQVLYRIDPPEPQANAAFGGYVAAVGDLNGDGVSELATSAFLHDVGSGCGTPEPNACAENQGKVWVFDGRTGGLRLALDNPARQGSTTNATQFGQLIGTAGDITGDGVVEIFVGAPRNDQPADCGSVQPLPAGCRVDEGQAFIFSGANGALIRTLNFPAEDRFPAGGATCAGSCGFFGGSVQSPGDVDGDGVADQLVGAHSAAFYTGTGTACGAPEPNGCNERQGRLYLFSGASGQLIRKIDNPFPQSGTFFGFQDVSPLSPGDVNGDGVPDLYGMVSQEGQFQGEGFVFSGATGALLYPLRMPNAEVGSSLFSMTRTDYNLDGTPDLLAGDIASGTAPVDQNGGAYIFDGRDGSPLKSFRLPEADRQVGVPGNFGPGLGWNVGAPGDVNGDGEPDYVAGALAYDEGSTIDAGRIYFFLSKVPPPPPRIEPPIAAPGTPLAPLSPRAVGKITAKLSLARATINRRLRLIDVLAPITARASGRVRVELHAAGRRFRFTAPIDSANGRIRFRQRIPASQARFGTGILTISYGGDADTRPQTVRLRAANRPAQLRLARPRIVNGRLQASGTVSGRARGVVRMQLEFDRLGVTEILRFRAPIRNGRWSLNEGLTATLSGAIGQRIGALHSYTLFTGYLPARMRGEMRSFQILGNR
jgi:hypothetical protein